MQIVDVSSIVFDLEVDDDRECIVGAAQAIRTQNSLVMYHLVRIRWYGDILNNAPCTIDAHRVVCSKGVRDKVQIADRMQIHLYWCEVVSIYDELGLGVMQHFMKREKLGKLQ